MNKIKIVKKRNEVYVQTKIISGQQLNQYEIELLGRGVIENLISPYIVAGRKPELMYRVTDVKPLREHLQTVISKEEFIRIVLSILDMMKKSQENMLNNANFLLNIDYMFIDPKTKEIIYIYLPIYNSFREYELLKLLVSIPYNTVFNQYEDCTYVSQYMAYFSSCPNFSIEDLETFIRRMRGTNEIQKDLEINIAHPSKILNKESKICVKCNQKYLTQGCFCENCGEKLVISYGEEEDLKVMQQMQPVSQMQMMLREQIMPQVQQVSQVTSAVSAGTTVLGVAECGTTVLSPQELGVVVYPHIIRKSNGERIDINTDKFVVGQSTSANYVVSGNTAISRNHACIITKNGKYYITDNTSTNGTYIDGVRISSNVEVEIASGQKIRFANEEYEFLV
ncbi:MAG: FHA domain-containing protein [Lachnospiraceae bacterium]|nr:FHA domain-containing protein [Lachnospiraceae bacterium]